MSAFLHRSLQVWRQRSVALFANNSKTGWKTPLFFWRNTLSIFDADHKPAKKSGKNGGGEGIRTPERNFFL
jgi:hypothetical protein